MPADYRIEHARSNRSLCRGQCKANIEQNALRIGTITEVNDQERTFWRHFPKCTTPTVAQHILTRYGSADKVSGMDELSPALRKRACKALNDLAHDLPVKGLKQEENDDEEEDDEDKEEDEEGQHDDEGEGFEPPAKRRQVQQGQRSEYSQRAQRRQQGQQQSARSRQAMGGKKSAAIRRARAEGREYRKGEECELYGGVDEDEDRDADQQGQHRGRGQRGQDRRAEVRRDKAGSRQYYSHSEDNGSDDYEEEEHEADKVQSSGEVGELQGQQRGGGRRNNVSAGGRRRQAEGGKKGAAVRQARAQSRDYREGEENGSYGRRGQNRGR